MFLNLIFRIYCSTSWLRPAAVSINSGSLQSTGWMPATRLYWDNITPLGAPVVPEEKGRMAISFLISTIAGSGMGDKLLDLMKSSQWRKFLLPSSLSPTTTALVIAGVRSRVCWSFPIEELWPKIQVAVEADNCLEISWVVDPGLIGVTVMPRYKQPSTRTGNSIQFGRTIPTLSPFCRPSPVRDLAICRACSFNYKEWV